MKFSQEQIGVLNSALKVWGEYEQKRMAVGECGEFLALIGKESRNRTVNEDWISEIADVTIMMEQMAIIYGYQKVQDMIEYKMDRLKKRLEKYD